MKMARIKLLIMKFTLLGAGCILSLILLEIGLRLFNPIENRIRGEKIVLPVNKQYRLESNIRGIDHNVIHSKNSIGFRGPDLPKNGFADYLSILAVGGSTTECFLLSDGRDWPSLLQKLIKNDFSPIWLNNAGLDGHSTFGHTILLNDIIVNLKPKVVIFLVGANDREREEAGEHTASAIKGPLGFSSVEDFIKSASAYSEVAAAALNFYRYLRAKFGGLTQQDLDLRTLSHVQSPISNINSVLEPHINKYVPAYEKRLRAMIQAARTAQIDPVLITQPLLFGEGVDPITGVNLCTLKIDKDMTGLEAWSILKLYNETTIMVGRQENVFTIDLAHKLEKNSEYFHDGLHFTNEGSREVAKIIYSELHPYLLQKYSQYKKPHTGTLSLDRGQGLSP